MSVSEGWFEDFEEDVFSSDQEGDPSSDDGSLIVEGAGPSWATSAHKQTRNYTIIDRPALQRLQASPATRPASKQGRFGPVRYRQPRPHAMTMPLCPSASRARRWRRCRASWGATPRSLARFSRTSPGMQRPCLVRPPPPEQQQQQQQQQPEHRPALARGRLPLCCAAPPSCALRCAGRCCRDLAPALCYVTWRRYNSRAGAGRSVPPGGAAAQGCRAAGHARRRELPHALPMCQAPPRLPLPPSPRPGTRGARAPRPQAGWQAGMQSGAALKCTPPLSAGTCGVCFCEVAPEASATMDCGHSFCRSCWRQHLRLGVQEGLSRRLRCMGQSCGVICNEDKASILSWSRMFWSRIRVRPSVHGYYSGLGWDQVQGRLQRGQSERPPLLACIMWPW
jgi:hypothetical protein